MGIAMVVVMPTAAIITATTAAMATKVHVTVMVILMEATNTKQVLKLAFKAPMLRVTARPPRQSRATPRLRPVQEVHSHMPFVVCSSRPKHECDREGSVFLLQRASTRFLALPVLLLFLQLLLAPGRLFACKFCVTLLASSGCWGCRWGVFVIRRPIAATTGTGTGTGACGCGTASL